MVRLLLCLLGMVTAAAAAAGLRATAGPAPGVATPRRAVRRIRAQPPDAGPGPPARGAAARAGRCGRRRGPGPAPGGASSGVAPGACRCGSSGAAAAVALGLIFRRAIASVVLIALSSALHFLGINVHLPSIRFAWPWQTISTGTTTNTDLGPWVLQKIEGISKPALGQANFNFCSPTRFPRASARSPCWYASTFYAVGHASATVDLNPGPAWWRPAYRPLPAAGPQPPRTRASPGR